MSKSLGNGIDPLEIIDQYGADALRFMLITGNTPGNDLRFQKERLEAARNFANKIWNASRFVLMNLDDYEAGSQEVNYTLADQWILEELRKTAVAITENFGKYELGEAARAIYDFSWDYFCDWYIEMAKPRLYGQDAADKYTAQTVLLKVLTTTLEMLHPFMPFLTEELWQALPHEGETIMWAAWPKGDDMPSYPQEAEAMRLVMSVVRSIRNVRAEMKVQPGKKADLILYAEEQELAALRQGALYIQTLGQIANITFDQKGAAAPEQAAAAHVKGIELYLPLKGLIDIEKEIARLEKEIATMDKELARLAGKLNNPGFLAKAPAEVIEKERAKEKEYAEKKAALLQRVEELK